MNVNTLIVATDGAKNIWACNNAALDSYTTLPYK